jgi:hypothetical protein
MTSHEVAAMLKVGRATMFRELQRVRDLKEIEAGR